MDNEIIVKSIKELCKKHGITANQLESNVGLSQGLISRWLKTTPSLDKIIDIADYFHVTLDEVVGRNINNSDEDDIIIALMQMTTNKQICWEVVSNYENQRINGESYSDLFYLYDTEEVEIYKCQYNDSYLFLVAQYDLEQGVIENLDIQLYLQPDSDSKPVYQDIGDNWIQEFWVGVRKPFKGVPDEWKADIIRKRITGQPIVGIFGLQDYGKIPNNSSNENYQTQDAITFLRSEEFKEIQKVLSDKELMDSIIYLANNVRINKSFYKLLDELNDSMSDSTDDSDE